MPLTDHFLTNTVIEKAKTDKSKSYLLSYCQKAGFCFHYKSNLFKKEPFCNSTENIRFKDLNAYTLNKFCPIEGIRKNLPYAENELCPSSSVRAVKVIRLKDINSIPDNLNVKTVHLIRDPRAVIASRNEITKYTDNDRIRNQAEKLCNSMNIAFDHRESENLYLVRYEDFVLEPLAGAKTILKFIGLDMHGDVLNRFSRRKRDSSTYTTMRTRDKSVGSMTKFVFRIDFEQIDVIQNTCSEFFENFHYKKITLDDFYLMKKMSVFERYNYTLD